MSNKVGDFFIDLFFKKRLTGELRFSVNVLAGGGLEFRLEAVQATVEWGDGEVSQKVNSIEPLAHTYAKSGIYHVCVKGRSITDIDIPRSNIVALDVTQCHTLEFIDCSDNQIPELDLRNCKGLYEVYCAKNKIRELKLSKYRKLFYLSCSCNELENIDLSGCTKLVTFRCRKNRLTQLDFRKCSKLVSVNIEQNNFSYEELLNLVGTLVKRPRYDTGFLVLQRNFENEDYYQAELQNLIKKRGWCEI